MKKRKPNLKREIKKLQTKTVPQDIEKIGNNIFKSISKPFRVDKRKLTTGQKAADKITYWAGSWTFILSFAFFLIIWIYINIWITKNYGEAITHDPYPFILLNLVLSCLAAIQAPVILMSQNREAQRDRLRAEYDYQINRKSEKEIRQLKTQLDRIEKKLNKK